MQWSIPSRMMLFPTFMTGICVLLAACTQVDDLRPPIAAVDDAISSTGEHYADYDIITVLPRDAIQAIDNPKFMTAAEADEQYRDDELILDVEFNGDARA